MIHNLNGNCINCINYEKYDSITLWTDWYGEVFANNGDTNDEAE